jgi:hypothetical protein
MKVLKVFSLIIGSEISSGLDIVLLTWCDGHLNVAELMTCVAWRGVAWRGVAWRWGWVWGWGWGWGWGWRILEIYSFLSELFQSVFQPVKQLGARWIFLFSKKYRWALGLSTLLSICYQRQVQNRPLKYTFLIGIVGGGVQLGPLGTAATNGLLCQPRLIMMMEELVEWWLARETVVLGENLPQCRCAHHKRHMLRGRETGQPRWETSF